MWTNFLSLQKLFFLHVCYTEKLVIAIYVLFYNDDSKKYQESRENRGAMVIIPSELEIFRSQNTKDSKNYIKLQYTEKNGQ